MLILLVAGPPSLIYADCSYMLTSSTTASKFGGKCLLRILLLGVYLYSIRKSWNASTVTAHLQLARHVTKLSTTIKTAHKILKERPIAIVTALQFDRHRIVRIVCTISRVVIMYMPYLRYLDI